MLSESGERRFTAPNLNYDRENQPHFTYLSNSQIALSAHALNGRAGRAGTFLVGSCYNYSK